jgi:hypothetical protein
LTIANKFAIRVGRIRKFVAADETGSATDLFHKLYDDAAEQADFMEQVNETTLYCFKDGSIFSTSGHAYADSDSYNKRA